MQDINGIDIKVGSKVAFAARKGSNAHLITGVVEEDNVRLHEGMPNRVGAVVKTKSGRSTYKDARELVVTAQ